MQKTTTLILCFAVLGACAEGDEDDGVTVGESGSVGSTDDTSGGMTGSMTSAATATTAEPTTGEEPTTTDMTDADSSTAGDSTGDDTGEALSCAEYCGIYSGACVDFNEYANEQDCLDNCAQWPIGEIADTAHDSLGCRTYHVTVASSADPGMHCPHAGPSGDATCAAEDAPQCDLYCTRYFTNCAEDLNAYADMDDCLDQCGGWYPGAEADVEGHTIGCHAYHAGAAIADPELHCPHAGPGGGGVCVL